MYGDDDYPYTHWYDLMYPVHQDSVSTNTYREYIGLQKTPPPIEDPPDEAVGNREPRRPITPSSADGVELPIPNEQEFHARLSQ